MESESVTESVLEVMNGLTQLEDKIPYVGSDMSEFHVSEERVIWVMNLCLLLGFQLFILTPAFRQTHS